MTSVLSPAVPAGVPGEGPAQMPLAGDEGLLASISASTR
jgi:hypothetical protein